MSYYTGTAADLTALRTAITDACVLNGWTWDSGEQVLHKGTMFFGLTITASSSGGFPMLNLLGKTALTGGENAPNAVLIRDGWSSGNHAFIYPIVYHIFIHGDEVWIVANVGNARYWHMAFGKSTIAGFPGSGSYVAAWPFSSGNSYSTNFNTVLFGETFWSSGYQSYWIHTGLNGGSPWSPVLSGSAAIGWGDISNLLVQQPNAFTQESILLPIRSFYGDAESKIILTLQLQHARYIRNDYLQNEQIIEYGPDKWMVFPAFTKDVTNRTQFTWSSGARSGTYAYALRYDGP